MVFGIIGLIACILNDEKDFEYSDSVYEQYIQNIIDIDKGIVELKNKVEAAKGEEKKELQDKTKKD